MELTHAYRQLYRKLLYAVQFAKPARYVARDQLRRAFRDDKATLDPRTVNRTLKFLDAAAQSRGIEHRVVKNLLVTAYHRHDTRGRTWKSALSSTKRHDSTDFSQHVHANAYRHYDMTVAMLNKSMGTGLR